MSSWDIDKCVAPLIDATKRGDSENIVDRLNNPKNRIPQGYGGITKVECNNLGHTFDNSITNAAWCFDTPDPKETCEASDKCFDLSNGQCFEPRDPTLYATYNNTLLHTTQSSYTLQLFMYILLVIIMLFFGVSAFSVFLIVSILLCLFSEQYFYLAIFIPMFFWLFIQYIKR
jgi:hypothetical protein